MTEFVLSYVEPAQERIVRCHRNNAPCWRKVRPISNATIGWNRAPQTSGLSARPASVRNARRYRKLLAGRSRRVQAFRGARTFSGHIHGERGSGLPARAAMFAAVPEVLFANRRDEHRSSLPTERIRVVAAGGAPLLRCWVYYSRPICRPRFVGGYPSTRGAGVLPCDRL